ncbi:MAG TPA: DUF2490 domain-containing protein, partial [Lacibacter sp.]|nr:DUF2490 domain-containing protein [Lacibacter sp.]
MKRTGNRRKKTQHVKPGHLLAMQAGFFNPRRYVAALVVVFTYMGHSSFAQPFDLGSWNIMHLRHHLTSKWSLFGEAQVRSLKFYTHFHYYEYKGGVHYRARPGLTLSLGLGDYDTYGEGGNFVVPKNNDELRIWPQLALQQSIGRFLVEQRYRAELRFTSQGYRNRFRYRVGLSYPFGK